MSSAKVLMRDRALYSSAESEYKAAIFDVDFALGVHVHDGEVAAWADEAVGFGDDVAGGGGGEFVEHEARRILDLRRWRVAGCLRRRREPIE